MSSFVPGTRMRSGALRQRVTFQRYARLDVDEGAHVDTYETVREDVPAAISVTNATSIDRAGQADTTQRKRLIIRTPRTWYPDASWKVLWRDPPWTPQGESIPDEQPNHHSAYISSVEDLDGYRNYTQMDLAMDPVRVAQDEVVRDHTP